MKSCGKRFHDEVGKFRFLNELIKVVSPKVGLMASCWKGLVPGGRRALGKWWLRKRSDTQWDMGKTGQC